MADTQKIALYDTTLRDGTQGEGINFSADDKVRIARMLDDAGFAFVEGGYPASNDRDRLFFERLQKNPLRNTLVAAFGMTMRAQSRSAAEDPMLRPLVEAGTPAVTVVGKSWDMQAEVALKTSTERNLEMIEESVAWLAPRVDHLLFDAEHFFDGYKSNRDYALQSLDAAVRGGAQWLVLCDTNGGTLPWEIEEITTAVSARFPENRIGIHCHNDTGNGIACTLSGVRGGAAMVQGTVGGIGERTGNADIIATAATLALKMDKEVLPEGRLPMLAKVTSLVYELMNESVPGNMPFVGSSAFAHKGGMHTSAVERDPRTYEHIDPELVGNRRRVLVSDLSGRASIRSKLEEFGYPDVPDETVGLIVDRLKALENEGFAYEGADASLDLLFRSAIGVKDAPFEVHGFRTTDVHFEEKSHLSEASIEVVVGDRREHTASFGNGPVNAIDNAFRKALSKFFPAIDNIDLLDYKVRVLSGSHGTGSQVRVLLSMTDGHRYWQTLGVSTDVIAASHQALADGYRWYLTRSESFPVLAGEKETRLRLA